jgi:NADH-quinone oxidoreductase subunit E
MSAQKNENETTSVFSRETAARFHALVEKYPVKRSALIPMLLYAQDEVGFLSDEVIAEVAHRIGITELDVRNVATYYSMLRFKRAGKFNVQVCTNISCMLRGAYDVYERFREELGVDNKGVTADGIFSLEEVECIGACCWAPAIQVNYEFHDDLTPEQVPAILSGYREQTKALTSPPSGTAAPENAQANAKTNAKSRVKSKTKPPAHGSSPSGDQSQDKDNDA